MPLTRLDENPLLTPDDLAPTRDDLTVLCTLNPAAVRFGQETLLLVRVGEAGVPRDGAVACAAFDEQAGGVVVRYIDHDDPDLVTLDNRTFDYRGWRLLTSMSHLRVARSTDGVHFAFDAQPAIHPDQPYEAYGCEDARITFLDGQYWITYTAVSARGVTVALASTSDFVSYEKHGVIFPPFQKDVCLFPERVRGMYVCRHRPFRTEFNPASIWTACSPDLRCWGHHEVTLRPVPGTWEAERVGAGAPPIRTAAGWLEIYHASDETGRYALGAMLSDLEHPERILTRSAEAVFVPEAPYELAGVYGNCVFSNGLVAEDDGTLRVYYGAADRICAGAVTSVDEMVRAAGG